ncbi:hypothetical protein B0I35DRAFT_407104 [Stachybotrys elegans]|uniref:Ecp2 effector protein domain-containing protein n=1 Tax=Stachybotrys elegans TaxID=80388 RepID=A0A8K0SZQ0_9HYPO|nr:hypothetical protein B0I35DRAFT_407104 [Stachybotrys elegans]
MRIHASLPALWLTLCSVPQGSAQQVPLMREEKSSLGANLWKEAVSQANATTSTPAIGYLTTSRYGEEIPGWEVSLSIVGNYPRSSSSSVSGAQISYVPPRSLQNRTDDESWGRCSIHVRIESHQDTSVDQDCGGVISDECRDALLQRVESAGGTCEQIYDKEKNTTISAANMFPEVCGFQPDDIHVGWDRYSVAFQQPLDVAMHEPGDFAAYDRLLRTVWLTEIGFFQSIPTEDGFESQFAKSPRGTLACLAPGAVEDGSRTYREGGAMMVKPGVALATAMVVALAMGLL